MLQECRRHRAALWLRFWQPEGAAKSTRMEQTKFIAYDLSGIEG